MEAFAYDPNVVPLSANVDLREKRFLPSVNYMRPSSLPSSFLCVPNLKLDPLYVLTATMRNSHYEERQGSHREETRTREDKGREKGVEIEGEKQ